MNYYSFHIADWSLHTSHLTLEEEGVFRRLLDFYYDTELPIPEITQPVIRRLRLVYHAETVALILAEFFVLEADGWHNLRADIEIADYHKKAETAKQNGKKGGRPKKNQGLETQPVILANPPETGSQANQEPRTKNQEPIETSKDQAAAAQPLPVKKKKPAPFDPLTAKPVNAGDAAWADYISSRKSKPTERACELIAEKLAGLSQDDVDTALLNSVANGWTGVFPEKNNHAAGQRINQVDNSAVGRVKQGIAARVAAEAQAAPAAPGYPFPEDGGNVRPPLDGEYRRVG